MISALEAANLLRKSTPLRPGDPLPGMRQNPVVVSIYEREDWAAGSLYVACGKVVHGRTMQQVAAALNMPLWIGDTIGERDLTRARAVLCGRMLDHAYVDTGHGMSGAPVNEQTVAEAVNLVTAALSVKREVA